MSKVKRIIGIYQVLRENTEEEGGYTQVVDRLERHPVIGDKRYCESYCDDMRGLHPQSKYIVRHLSITPSKTVAIDTGY